MSTSESRTLEKQLSDALDAMPVRSAHLWLLVLVAVGALLDAMTQSNIGLIAPRLMSHWALAASQLGLLSSATFLGMAIGSVAAGLTNDRYGRRFTYMYNLLLFTFGSLAAGLSPTFGVLLIARFVCGLGLGGELSTALTLVSETMPTRLRGAALGTVNIAAGGIGLFLAPAFVSLMLGPLEPLFGGPAIAWRWVLGIMVIPSLAVFFCRVFFLPESPRYVLSRGHIERANEILTKLAHGRLRRVAYQAPTEYIRAAEGTQLMEPHAAITDIFRGRLARRTIVIWTCTAMSFGAQLTIMVFMPTVLVARGYDVHSSLVYTTIMCTGGLIGSLFASWFGNRVPRRVVLGPGALIAIAVALAFGYATTFSTILLFGGLLQGLFILLNTTAWIWTPELYPTRLRGFGTGCAVTTGFLSASIFPTIAGWLFDIGGVLPLFVMVGLMYTVMAIAVVFGPETQGVSLEQISGGEIVNE